MLSFVVHTVNAQEFVNQTSPLGDFNETYIHNPNKNDMFSAISNVTNSYLKIGYDRLNVLENMSKTDNNKTKLTEVYNEMVDKGIDPK